MTDTPLTIKPMRLSPLWSLLALFSLGFPLFFYFIEQPEPPPIIEKAPTFQLFNHDNESLTSTDLKDRITLVNFIFTRCRDVCPGLTTKLKLIESQLDARADISYISLSVDPEFDTPEVLQAYRQKFDIQNPNWHFLTGPYDTIRDLMDSFQLAYQRGPSDDSIPNIIHSEKIILIDSNNQIRGFYSTDNAGITDLLIAISTL